MGDFSLDISDIEDILMRSEFEELPSTDQTLPADAFNHQSPLEGSSRRFQPINEAEIMKFIEEQPELVVLFTNIQYTIYKYKQIVAKMHVISNSLMSHCFRLWECNSHSFCYRT